MSSPTNLPLGHLEMLLKHMYVTILVMCLSNAYYSSLDKQPVMLEHYYDGDAVKFVNNNGQIQTTP